MPCSACHLIFSPLNSNSPKKIFKRKLNKDLMEKIGIYFPDAHLYSGRMADMALMI
jgi:hypothetical protein